MIKVPNFSAADWISENTYGGTRMSAEASAAVANFTTMWNFFEGTVCENKANVATFERVSRRFDPSLMRDITLKTLEQCLLFWQFRYQMPGGFGHRFDNLYFRSNDRRHHVEAVIQGRITNSQEVALALMIIVYRLRNNLFHGIKGVDMLNDQVQNLDNASRCLAGLLEGIRPHLVQPTSRQDVVPLVSAA